MDKNDPHILSFLKRILQHSPAVGRKSIILWFARPLAEILLEKLDFLWVTDAPGHTGLPTICLILKKQKAND